jgi:DNA-binding CsgD family transcriptional regulator
MAERERQIGAPASRGHRPGQSLSPALADIIGARRVRTAVMISSGSIPCRSAASSPAPPAAGHADEELALARRFGAARAIGVALHAHALVRNADQETLTEAIETLADCGARLEHARALIDLGSAIRRTGKRADARRALADGADLARRCGATALVDHARKELRFARARPRRIAQTGRDVLTPAELRVVELAAQGQTHKQIAQALFVTLRTVEMHLSNSYRKLDIETREQLPAALNDS